MSMNKVPVGMPKNDAKVPQPPPPPVAAIAKEEVPQPPPAPVAAIAKQDMPRPVVAVLQRGTVEKRLLPGGIMMETTSAAYLFGMQVVWASPVGEGGQVVWARPVGEGGLAACAPPVGEAVCH